MQIGSGKVPFSGNSIFIDLNNSYGNNLVDQIMEVLRNSIKSAEFIHRDACRNN